MAPPEEALLLEKTESLMVTLLDAVMATPTWPTFASKRQKEMDASEVVAVLTAPVADIKLATKVESRKAKEPKATKTTPLEATLERKEQPWIAQRPEERTALPLDATQEEKFERVTEDVDVAARATAEPRLLEKVESVIDVLPAESIDPSPTFDLKIDDDTFVVVPLFEKMEEPSEATFETKELDRTDTRAAKRRAKAPPCVAELYANKESVSCALDASKHAAPPKEAELQFTNVEFSKSATPFSTRTGHDAAEERVTTTRRALSWPPEEKMAAPVPDDVAEVIMTSAKSMEEFNSINVDPPASILHLTNSVWSIESCEYAAATTPSARTLKNWEFEMDMLLLAAATAKLEEFRTEAICIERADAVMLMRAPRWESSAAENESKLTTDETAWRSPEEEFARVTLDKERFERRTASKGKDEVEDRTETFEKRIVALSMPRIWLSVFITVIDERENFCRFRPKNAGLGEKVELLDIRTLACGEQPDTSTKEHGEEVRLSPEGNVKRSSSHNLIHTWRSHLKQVEAISVSNSTKCRAFVSDVGSLEFRLTPQDFSSIPLMARISVAKMTQKMNPKPFPLRSSDITTPFLLFKLTS